MNKSIPYGGIEPIDHQRVAIVVDAIITTSLFGDEEEDVRAARDVDAEEVREYLHDNVRV